MLAEGAITFFRGKLTSRDTGIFVASVALGRHFEISLSALAGRVSSTISSLTSLGESGRGGTDANVGHGTPYMAIRFPVETARFNVVWSFTGVRCTRSWPEKVRPLGFTGEVDLASVEIFDSSVAEAALTSVCEKLFMMRATHLEDRGAIFGTSELSMM
jgi:hypothetical protein